jgi:hypothetical protein
MLLFTFMCQLNTYARQHTEVKYKEATHEENSGTLQLIIGLRGGAEDSKVS